ncbi:uncharacterized protein LOC121376792 [Gigantopelta aegis]|uniref:uncharacterized protein LOC121376792 n=1 Tax=Gigantopelta aegis TaxID=1735272 RepID=UPI001B88BE57|nr:uncharacterized protein LOC121376792 [Gigantopelta aegis]
MTNETSTKQNRFWFHKPSTRLYFNVDYDVDDLYPISEQLTIEAVDSKGATGTARIDVKIADTNDNVPYCNMTGYRSRHGNIFVYDVAQGDGTGTISSITAGDKDRSAPNNDVTLTVVGQSSNYVTYDNGAVVYAKTFDDEPNINRKRSQFVYIEARDHGSPSLSSTCIVIISYSTTTTTTTTTPSTTTVTTTAQSTTPTTTTREPGFFEQEGNVAIFSLLMTLLGLLLLVGLYFLCRCCCKGSCCPYQEPQMPPYRHYPPIRDTPNYKEPFRYNDHVEDGVVISASKMEKYNSPRLAELMY